MSSISSIPYQPAGSGFFPRLARGKSRRHRVDRSVRHPCYPRKSRSRATNAPTLPWLGSRLGNPGQFQRDIQGSKCMHSGAFPDRCLRVCPGQPADSRSLPRQPDSAPSGVTRICDRWEPRRYALSRLGVLGRSPAWPVGEAQNAGRHARQTDSHLPNRLHVVSHGAHPRDLPGHAPPIPPNRAP